MLHSLVHDAVVIPDELRPTGDARLVCSKTADTTPREPQNYIPPLAPSEFRPASLVGKALSNGGLRSGSPGSSRCSRELLVLDCSFSNNTATSSGDGDRGGSALQVFNTNVSVSNSDFAGNKGTAVYIETSYDGSDDSETYLVAVRSCRNNTLP